MFIEVPFWNLHSWLIARVATDPSPRAITLPEPLSAEDAREGVFWALAVLGFTYAANYAFHFPAVRRHRRPILAGLAFVGGATALLAAVWSPRVAKGLARFALSPGLGSLAAVAAASLALYGVFRQIDSRATQDRRDEERVLESNWAEHYRWVVERIQSPEAGLDRDMNQLLIEGLFDRASTLPDPAAKRSEEAAIRLLEAYLDKYARAQVVEDGDEDTPEQLF